MEDPDLRTGEVGESDAADEGSDDADDEESQQESSEDSSDLEPESSSFEEPGSGASGSEDSSLGSSLLLTSSLPSRPPPMAGYFCSSYSERYKNCCPSKDCLCVKCRGIEHRQTVQEGQQMMKKVAEVHQARAEALQLELEAKAAQLDWVSISRWMEWALVILEVCSADLIQTLTQVAPNTPRTMDIGEIIERTKHMITGVVDGSAGGPEGEG